MLSLHPKGTYYMVAARSSMTDKRGFTLIELIIITGVLGVIATLVIQALDPVAQLNKGRDAGRMQDLREVRTALDTYYNDHNRYPLASVGVPFGSNSPWSDNNAVYMTKVPQDPDAPPTRYFYQTDSSASPQWFVLYAWLKRSSATPVCSLPVGCQPTNFDSSKLFCITSGEVDCSVITASTIP